ncbi:MAG TPA: hypothetical protein VEB20_02180 [Azospirillaceae bacterium]|nr:hypothetical protein [Azospirillaceae bacterium]
MSKKDHPGLNQIKNESKQPVPKGHQNQTADTPVDPGKAGQGHQRQPKP